MGHKSQKVFSLCNRRGTLKETSKKLCSRDNQKANDGNERSKRTVRNGLLSGDNIEELQWLEH